MLHKIRDVSIRRRQESTQAPQIFRTIAAGPPRDVGLNQSNQGHVLSRVSRDAYTFSETKASNPRQLGFTSLFLEHYTFLECSLILQSSCSADTI